MADQPPGGLPFGFGPTDPADGGAGMGAADLGRMLQQFGAMLQRSGDGPVAWDVVRDVARQTLAGSAATATVGFSPPENAADPALVPADREKVRVAYDLADLWLNDATALGSTGRPVRAWSRAEWVEQTLPGWKPYVEPVAQRVAEQSDVSSMLTDPGLGDELREGLPPGLAGMLGGLPGGAGALDDPGALAGMLAPLAGMMKSFGTVAFSQMTGQGLGALAGEVLSGGDIGIPLTDHPVLVPAGIAGFADGLVQSLDDVRLYLALREAAHHRLFTHAPWLRGRIAGLITDYSRGVKVDLGRIRELGGSIDPSDPQALQQALSSGMLTPSDTPEQKLALERLEVVLALVEGWVDRVVSDATAERMPAAVALGEQMRRRRASGGPAEQVFAQLVGLELRPRRAREAAALWWTVAAKRGIAARDECWTTPDPLPGASDLEDPDAFATNLPG